MSTHVIWGRVGAIGLAAALTVAGLKAETLRLFNDEELGAYHGVEDTTIKADSPEASWGGAPTLEVGGNAKALIRFSLPSSIPAQSEANLNLTIEKIEGDWSKAEIAIYQVAPAAGGWSAGRARGQSENGATCWNYLLFADTKDVNSGQPLHTRMIGQRGFGEAGKDYLPAPIARIKLPPDEATKTVAIPVSPELIETWKAAANTNPGLLVVAEGVGPGGSAKVIFSSSEAARIDARPALVIKTSDSTPSGLVIPSAGGKTVISYSLKRSGFVSLNVYNEQGQVVREILHAAERSAGRQEESWDGLDEAGQKAASGPYSWKLLETQGLRTEYLMTLGLSVDFFHNWPGNHVGATGLAVDASGVYFGSGCSEAPGFVMKMSADGQRLWSVNEYWFEAWQGPHTLAVDGNNLFMMQENYDVVRLSADQGKGQVIWDLVYDKSKPKDRPASTRDDGGWVKMKLGQAGETAAVDLAAGSGKLVMTYENFNCFRWIDPEKGRVLKEIKITSPLGVAIDNKGCALVISEGQILAFDDAAEVGTPVIAAEQLTSPWRLSVNRANGEIWVAERGASQQIKRFSAEGKLLQTYGVKGGRPEQGLYDGRVGFRRVNSIAAAPDGSFWVAEAFAAPRRIAHFDAAGKLLREWYGPQMYANRASVDPADPSIVWMDSMWGELIQAKVDYGRKSWTVLATYSYMNPLQPRYAHERGMWFVGHVGGKTYLAKETEPNVLLVDEPGRRLVPMSMIGTAFYPGGNAGWRIPEELRPAESPWPGQTAPSPAPAAPWHFNWWSKSGDGKIVRDDINFGRELLAFPHDSFVRPDLTYVTSIDVSWKEADNKDWHRQGGPTVLKPTLSPGKSVPYYDLQQAGNLPLKLPAYLGAIRCLWEDKEGNIFTAHNTVKSRAGKGPFGVGKTAVSLGGNLLAKWHADGSLQWVVGQHAAGAKAGPGEARMFYRMAGSARGCIGVNDIDYGMVHLWDQDGLWVGRPMESGVVTATVPKEAYVLCGENFGGYLFENSQDGQVYLLGGTQNATAVYRIDGWQDFERQQGRVSVK